MFRRKNGFGTWMDEFSQAYKTLGAAFKDMNEQTFCYHSNEAKSDFSNCLIKVIGDVTLAKQLQKTATRTVAARKVETRFD